MPIRSFQDGPLKDRFPRLFATCDNPVLLVHEAFAHDGEGVGFRRTFDQVSAAEWAALNAEMDDVFLREGPDEVVWALEPTGRFSVASMYRALARGATVLFSRDLWEARLPLKIKIFTWQLVLDRLSTSMQLAKRSVRFDGACALYGDAEDASHIFFTCALAKLGWSVIRSLLGCG